jgi:ribonuclease BN (tRNA processing enzyme)
MNHVRITVLGSSSGMPSPSRFCSSLFFQTVSFNFLLDCGEGTSFSLLKNKIDPELIDAVFISHAHADHLGGLFLLIQMMHLLKRRIPLEIYLPEETVQVFRNCLDAYYLFPDKINSPLNLQPVTGNFKFERKGLTIQTHSNRHLMGNQETIDTRKLPNRMQSFCYELKLNGKKIVYSGDIESEDDLIGIIDEADFLITECFHPKLDRLFSLILGNRVKSTLFTHIPAEMEGGEKEILIHAQKMGLENSSIAHDGLVIEI